MMKLNDFLEKYVVKDNADLKNKMQSVQYPLSNKIMSLESKLHLNQKETAKVVGITLDKLLLMESVDLSISVSEYQNVVDKLEQFKYESSKNSIN